MLREVKLIEADDDYYLSLPSHGILRNECFEMKTFLVQFHSLIHGFAFTFRCKVPLQISTR